MFHVFLPSWNPFQRPIQLFLCFPDLFFLLVSGKLGLFLTHSFYVSTALGMVLLPYQGTDRAVEAQEAQTSPCCVLKLFTN